MTKIVRHIFILQRQNVVITELTTCPHTGIEGASAVEYDFLQDNSAVDSAGADDPVTMRLRIGVGQDHVFRDSPVFTCGHNDCDGPGCQWNNCEFRIYLQDGEPLKLSVYRKDPVTGVYTARVNLRPPIVTRNRCSICRIRQSEQDRAAARRLKARPHTRPNNLILPAV